MNSLTEMLIHCPPDSPDNVFRLSRIYYILALPRRTWEDLTMYFILERAGMADLYFSFSTAVTALAPV
jgi:hypothetical protein